MTPDWNRLLSASSYRYSMGLRRVGPASFWSPWDPTGRLLRERERWLQASPSLFRACLDGHDNSRYEALAWMQRFATRPEPDWLVLQGSAGEEPRLVAGEVVFPSSWSLPAKLGLPMSAIHQPVPGLEESLGAGIAAFLQKLQPGVCFGRENWGLSADDALNHHPAFKGPGPGPQATLETTWVRLEHQFLTRLEKSGAILFGIRVSCHRLDAVTRDQDVRRGMHQALMTMHDSLASYKGLLSCRPALLTQLAEPAQAQPMMIKQDQGRHHQGSGDGGPTARPSQK